MLETSLTLEFDLADNPIVNTPLCAQVLVGLEPSSPQSYSQLSSAFFGKETRPELPKVEGMLRIVEVIPKPLEETLHLESDIINLWVQSRKHHDEIGLASSPIVILTVHMINEIEGVNVLAVGIHSGAIEMARMSKLIPPPGGRLEQAEKFIM